MFTWGMNGGSIYLLAPVPHTFGFHMAEYKVLRKCEVGSLGPRQALSICICAKPVKASLEVDAEVLAGVNRAKRILKWCTLDLPLPQVASAQSVSALLCPDLGQRSWINIHPSHLCKPST